jgi:hypothetical protein
LAFVNLRQGRIQYRPRDLHCHHAFGTVAPHSHEMRRKQMLRGTMLAAFKLMMSCVVAQAADPPPLRQDERVNHSRLCRTDPAAHRSQWALESNW